MFLFKEGSRNAFNNDRAESKFLRNYQKLFKVRLPHMDTVDEVMRLLSPEELEGLKVSLVQTLFKKKVFNSSRLKDKWYLVAVDGTHVVTVKEGHCDECLTRTHKSGKVTYFHNVLEAKLMTSQGFSISLATEWIANFEDEFEKQDCELKAFKRLSDKLKTAFPHLPICLLADALYPNDTVFSLCQKYHWQWIITFKDGNLPSVWQEIQDLEKLGAKKQRTQRIPEKSIQRQFTWINEIDYQEHKLHWFQCDESALEKTRVFAYVASLEINPSNVIEMTKQGRMRWKIENEGFNSQKNQGYGMEHQYSRVSFNAMKNYYQCLQIAHLFNQLFERQARVQEVCGKLTIRHLWKKLIAQMTEKDLSLVSFLRIIKTPMQMRFS